MKYIIKNVHYDPPVYMRSLKPERNNRNTTTKDPDNAMWFKNMESANQFFKENEILTENWEIVTHG